MNEKMKKWLKENKKKYIEIKVSKGIDVYYLKDKYQLDMDVTTFLEGIEATMEHAYHHEIPLKDGILELIQILKYQLTHLFKKGN